MDRIVYNTRVLPNINEVWIDKETYPYACIRDMNDLGLNLIFCKTVGSKESSGIWYVSIYEGKSYWLNETKDGWDYEAEYFGLNFEPKDVTWSNFDIIDEDGTVYLAASDPIPLPSGGATAVGDYAIIPIADYKAACDSIRAKTGKNKWIKSGDMASEITGLKVTEPVLQEKTATENGEVTADEGYDGLSKVTVEVSEAKSLVDRTITEISLPNVTKIGASAFKGCIYLKTIHMPSVTSIETDAFNNCEELELTSLPDGVTNIGNTAFYYCRKLSLTSLPSSLTTIGARAFYFCQKIIDISIPISVESIDSYAFSQCSGLMEITFNGTPTSIDKNAFAQCSKLTQINVPWAEGEVADAPWGATNATINYNYTAE